MSRFITRRASADDAAIRFLNTGSEQDLKSSFADLDPYASSEPRGFSRGEKLFWGSIASIVAVAAASPLVIKYQNERARNSIPRSGECAMIVPYGASADSIAQAVTPDGKEYRVVRDEISPQGIIQSGPEIGGLAAGQTIIFDLPEGTDPNICATYTPSE